MVERTQIAIAFSLAMLLVGCTRSKPSLTQPSRNESNWALLNTYVHPDAQKSARLRLDELIDESSNGLVYRVDLSLAELDQWYSSRFPVSIRDEFEHSSGRAGIYFETDDQYRDTMVLLFDTHVPEANEALSELLAPKRIQSIAEGPCLIAVAFLNDPVEAIRLLREINDTTQ